MSPILHAVFFACNHHVYQRRVYSRHNAEMKDDYKRLLRAARDLRGWMTAAEVSSELAKAGYAVSEQTMTNWKSRGVSKEGRLNASRIIGCRPHWVESGSGNMADTETISAQGPSGTVPVVGTAQLGDNGYWAELEYPEGYGDGRVIIWSRDRYAYAIRCRGDSMRPRVQDGEFVVIEPNDPPIPGDEVLVKHKDGRVMIKKFLYERDHRLHLLSVNDAHPPKAFPLSEIELFHRVVAILKKDLWLPE